MTDSLYFPHKGLEGLEDGNFIYHQVFKFTDAGLDTIQSHIIKSSFPVEDVIIYGICSLIILIISYKLFKNEDRRSL